MELILSSLVLSGFGSRVYKEIIEMLINPRIRPLPLIEGGLQSLPTSILVGDNFNMIFQLQDINGSPIDVSTGTVAISVYNKQTGVAVSVVGSTTTKSLATSGIITFSNFTWSTVGTYNLYITYTNTSVRKFGPYRVEVEAL